MTLKIEQGMYGMFYGEDPDNPNIFIAAKTEADVREHIKKIHSGEYEGTVVLHPGEDQTEAQRTETIARLRKNRGVPEN